MNDETVKQLTREVMKDLRIAKARSEGMTISQIAERLGWSISTVRRSLQRSGSWYRPAAPAPGSQGHKIT
jgi:IS30 family transposase